MATLGSLGIHKSTYDDDFRLFTGMAKLDSSYSAKSMDLDAPIFVWLSPFVPVRAILISMLFIRRIFALLFFLINIHSI